MIIEETFYAVKCDNCGNIHEDCNGGSFLESKSDIEMDAIENDWVKTEDTHYCPNCYGVWVMGGI